MFSKPSYLIINTIFLIINKNNFYFYIVKAKIFNQILQPTHNLSCSLHIISYCVLDMATCCMHAIS